MFSESAPAYFIGTPQWYDVLAWVGQYGQQWRTGTDEYSYDPTNPTLDRFSSVLWNYFYNLPLGRFQKPGNWDDPDFVIAGDPELTIPEARSQFALWSMMSAPLILGVDLTQITPDGLAILGNTRVIAVDQDPLGHMATLLERNATMDVLIKPMKAGYAVTLLNRGSTALPLTITASDLGFASGCSFALQDLWSGTTTASAHQINADVAAHDAGIWKVTPSAACGMRRLTGTIIMTVPSLLNKSGQYGNYAQCLSSAEKVEVCSAAATETWTWGAGGTLIDQNGECLDDIGGQPSQAQCNSSSTQQWRYTELGNLINHSDNQCLSATIVNNLPTTVTMQACGHNLANQIWSLTN